MKNEFEVIVPPHCPHWIVCEISEIRLNELESPRGVLRETPHFKFAQIYYTTGNIEFAAKESGYWNNINTIREPADRENALITFAKICDSIKDEGYAKGKHKGSLILIRYGTKTVFDGTHRAAALLALSQDCSPSIIEAA